MNYRVKHIFLIRPYKQGFTLIEILLSVTLFAFIALALYGILRGALEVNERAQRINGRYAELRRAFELMDKDIENAVYYNFADSYPQLSSFQGEPNKLTFLLTAPEGLKAISYYLKDFPSEAMPGNMKYADTQVLIRDERSFLDFLNDNGNSHREVLSFLISKGGLKFGYAPAFHHADWQKTWTQDVLPSAVQIELTVKDPDLTLTKEVLIGRKLILIE